MKDEFLPVFRFAVCSDAHIEGIGAPGYYRLQDAVDYCLDFACKNENYNKLDTFVIAGDITNRGTKAEFNAFKEIYDYGTNKGVNFICTVAKGHDSIAMGKKSLEYFSSITNQETDFHRVIGGYHFIGLSTCNIEKKNYSISQKLWLKKQLKAASKASGNKPMFVFHHEHVKNTVFGSSDFDGWGNRFFGGMFEKYPNVVDFSGHSHYPVNDPRSVWQGEFTAFGTGSLKYVELTVDDDRKVHPTHYDSCANFLIVELDKESNMRVFGIDAMEEEILCEYYLKNPADKNNREYAPEKQRSRAVAPHFPEGAEPDIDINSNDIYVAIHPEAECEDGTPVFIYRVYVENEKGETVKCEKKIPAGYYLFGTETEIRTCIGRIDKGRYKLKIFAENVYGMKSEYIEKEFEI